MDCNLDHNCQEEIVGDEGQYETEKDSLAFRFLTYSGLKKLHLGQFGKVTWFSNEFDSRDPSNPDL
jgi:hypothetical protein